MPYLVAPAVAAGRMSSRPQPTLTAGRLCLRPWSDRDVDALVAAYADDAIQHWHARTLASAREARDLIAEWNSGWATEKAARWAIEDAGLDVVAGQAALRSVDFAEGEGEISYWVMPQHRRSGVATASVRAVTQWAFDDLGLHRLELHHSVANTASCRVADRAGFPLEGTMRGKGLHTDGWHDMHLHARVCDAAGGPTAGTSSVEGDDPLEPEVTAASGRPSRGR